MSALELTDVVVDYARRGGGRVRAVAGASISVERGQIVGLVGESGCGKSTLARAAVGLVRPTSGSVVFEGREIAPLGRRGRSRELARLQLVFQNPYASLNPRRKVGSQLADALDTLDLVPAAGRPARVQELLELVGLPATAAERFPHEFSGGQRQRIAIARTLAADPSVLVLDEPLGVARRLGPGAARQPARQPLPRARPRAAPHLARPRDRPPRRRRRLGHVPRPHGRDRADRPALGAAAPPLQRVADQRDSAPGRAAASCPTSLPGEVPDPGQPPSGCRFHPRCPYAFSRCSAEEPPLVTLADGRSAACWLQPEGSTAASPARTRPTCRRCRRPIASYACTPDPSRTEEHEL